jgi:hypothetical protein
VSRPRTHAWYDVAWPLATGLVTGLGLVAAYRWTGPLMFLVAFAVLQLTVAPVAWSLLTEVGFDVRRIALRVAPIGSAMLLAVIGLADAIGGWTFLVAGIVVVTSPMLQGWREEGWRGVLVDRVSSRADTRRRFDEIVGYLSAPDEDLPR